VRAPQALPLLLGHLLADQIVEVRYPDSLQLPFEQIGQVAETGARARLGPCEWDAEEVGDLALRKLSVVRELDHVALVVAQSLEARCTRHETYEVSARSAGPGSAEAVSGTSAGGSLRFLLRSTIALRATV